MSSGVSKAINSIVFWLFWPVVFIALRNSHRTRLLLFCESKILVTKGWLSSGRWGLPGGGLERDEQPLSGLLRELKEETGLALDPKIVTSLGEGEISEKGIHYQARYFTARVSQTLNVRARREIMKVAWLDPDDLNSNNAEPDALEALRLYRER